MDDFVCEILNECGLSHCKERFKDEGIDKQSLYCLDDQDITHSLIPKLGPRAKFKKRLKLLKRQQEHEEAADSAQVRPFTSDTSGKGKRKLDHQGESSKCSSPPRKRQCDIIPEDIFLGYVRNLMRIVKKKLPCQDKLSDFLRKKIDELEIDKREVVGVFGKTGAGKSFLINAVTGEKNLLPSGSINACTSVMIKVEANIQSPKYEAEIEFIGEQEWKDELWPLQEKDDDYDKRDLSEKLSALYGEEWINKSPENLMDRHYFEEIPEFLKSQKKILTGETAEELSAKFGKYTRSDSKDRDSKGIKKRYWPLVKCVTVRVPGNVLKHVTLVDLPGSGDRNKSRDTMWKTVVGSCSTVWIVAEINRAAAEKDAWEILETACSLMGNGGQCQEIHFICTKSDLLEDSNDHAAAKKEVNEEFNKQNKVKKHFTDDCFKVFTVSSKEFFNQTHLNPEENEIRKLQDFLKDLNDCHSETLNYVSGAHGILSLIQGVSCGEVAAKKTEVCTKLEENLRRELKKVTDSIEETYEAFEKCLSEGVQTSKSSSQAYLKSVLYPSDSPAFHRTLRSLVEKHGTHKPKDKEQINLNMKLASCLTDSIDEEFRKIFPNGGKRGPFNGVINGFSLDTEQLIRLHKDVELQLKFLQTEEEQLKKKLNKTIREQKKNIYSSLTTTIEETMAKCYKEAAEFKQKDSMNKMRYTIMKHVQDTLFEEAETEMLKMLKTLKDYILKTVKETMEKSIELSLKTDGVSILDVTEELTKVEKYYNELKQSSDEETSLTCADPPSPSAAP